MVKGGIKNKSVDLANKWYTNENGGINVEKFNIMVEQEGSILNIKDDNNTFKKELVCITTT